MACRAWGQLGERLRRMTMSGPSAWRSRRAAPRHGAWWRGGGESAVRRAQSHRARAGTPTPTARTFCVASATNHPLPDVPGPKVRVYASSADMSSAAWGRQHARRTVWTRVWPPYAAPRHMWKTGKKRGAWFLTGAAEAARADAEARHGAELPFGWWRDDGHRRRGGHPAGRPRSGGAAAASAY